MINLLNKVFSMRLMAVAMLAFFAAIAAATFIENDYTTPVAQKLVYKAWWFEGILFYLSFSMLFNIYRYKLVQWKKIGSLIFHVSFLITVIGAYTTRLVGFEGAMMIREGASSNIILSYDTYMQIKVHDMEQQYKYDMPIILDGHTNNYFNHEFEFPGQSEPISIEFVDLVDHAKDTIVPVGKSKGSPYLEIVTIGQDGRKYNYLKSGDVLTEQELKIGFNNTDHTDAISIFETDSGICVTTPYELGYLQMSDQSAGTVARDSIQSFKTKRLYSVMGIQFVFNAYYPSAELQITSSPSVDRSVKALTINAGQGENKKEIVLTGGKGMYPQRADFKLGDLYYELAYGSKIIELPFFVYLDDFVLDRYPGTENPMSYSSYVTLVDPTNGLEEEHHIYMNNVMDYQGYRFFQSSYDRDEMGTILSVNHDAAGTNLTYLGYLLMGLGFIVNLFQRDARFSYLLKKSKELRTKRMGVTSALVLGLFLAGSTASFAQEDDGGARENEVFQEVGEIPALDAGHAEKFGRLVVQNQQGRFQPVHSLATDFLRKVSRQNSYEGLSPMQVFLGIHTSGMAWNLEPFIYVSGKEVRKKLNIEDSRASLVDFFSLDFKYLLEEDAEIARRKKPSEQSQYDKDVLKTDERLNIVYGVFTGLYMKIIPLPNDPGEHWYSPYDKEHPFEGEDAEFMNSIIPLYTMAVGNAQQTDNWEEANKVIELISTFQRRVANPETIPSVEKIEWEIFYNNADIFKRITPMYLLIGFVLLIFLFVQIFKPTLNLKWPERIGAILFALLMVYHGFGLVLRWYLSGHAPWSDGYEATVFIAWVGAVASLIFGRMNSAVLGGGAIIVWLLLFVSGLNIMDPQMTNLVPVLNSYWLKIHVAVITGSYAFLGLSAILGLICMIMNFFVNNNNIKRVKMTTKELTYISEMVMIIGLFMLTIGTFLGGVWANESWGRYWGWDAKETWALASVIIYGIILHFRFVPGLKGQFAFNVASLWGYGSIIMTFFGVNYYLSGLHSYAQGDPVPIPTWVPVTVASLFILSVGSGIIYHKMRKSS